MVQSIHVSERDTAILRLLDLTPATAAQIRKASLTFPGEPFRDDRRTRERLQAMAQAGLIRLDMAAASGGGSLQYYRVTSDGAEHLAPDRRGFRRSDPIPLSRFAHSQAVADVIIHCLVQAHKHGIAIGKAHGDGQLRLEIGEHRIEPDAHLLFQIAGRTFNVLFEIDNATEPLDSAREPSIRNKIIGFEAYQDWVLALWRYGDRRLPRPLFRVVFLTRSSTRANHMLWLASRHARNPDRRLIYAGTQDEFLAEPQALSAPILLDHHGQWQSLINTQPTARFLKSPVRLTPPIASGILI